MHCMNGLLILSYDEQQMMEYDIGPIVSTSIEDIRLRFIFAVAEMEQDGRPLQAILARSKLASINELFDLQID